MVQIPKEVMLFFASPKQLILYNAFTHTSLGVELPAVQLLEDIAAGHDPSTTQYTVWHIHYFSNEDGLLADPTQMIADVEKWPEAVTMTTGELIRHFKKLYFVVEDYNEYRQIFTDKTNLLDFKHQGNFHQQLGQHLLTELRVNPDEWWYNQKFNAGLGSLKDTLYKSIQGNFLETLFAREMKEGVNVIDIGCGIGYYSKLMAQAGANVIAVDPNTEFVTLANESTPDNLTFVASPIGDKPIENIEEGWADIIFMSDAMLFYFIKAAPNQKADIAILINDIKRLLKPDGKFISIEPHGTFLLAPWLGEEERPFTILTEFRNKKYGITPPLGDILTPFLSGGFALTKMEELYPHESGKEYTPRGHNFASEFPLWQLLEFRKNPLT